MRLKKLEPSVIQKEFNASQQVLFDMWTQAEPLSKWMFPMLGCTCEYTSADIRQNGSSLHKITMPNGNEMWLLTKYEELSTPNKLVFLQYISNEFGEILPNPHMPNWPEHMLATLSFEAISEQRSRLIFSWEPRNPSDEERLVFEDTRSSHAMGWNTSMQQLEILVSKK